MKPRILVATWSEGLFVLSDEGATHECAGQSVRGLAPDGRGGALALVGPHSLYRRDVSGEWTTLATSEYELSCCMAVRDAIFVGTDDDARLLRLESGRLETVEGFEMVPGRETWFAGSVIINGQRVGPPLGIRSLAANADESVLFANVHVGGIPCSLDGGKTWQPTIDPRVDVHEVRAHPENPEIIAAASAVGLCLSRDSGARWTIERDGLHAPHCSAVAFSGDGIFISASTDPFAAQGRIYRRPVDGEGMLRPVEGGIPEWTAGIVDTGCIAASGSMIAVADRAGNVYLSTDFGRKWSRCGSELPAPSAVLIC